MKKIKVSFAVVVAILAVSVAVVSKAHTFGAKQITGCFFNLSLKNAAAGTSSLANASNILAASAQDIAEDFPYVTGAASPVPSSSCPSTVRFCCATVSVTTNTAAPLIDLGDGVQRRYQINQLFYKP